jgi:O-methyltransferase domain/Dimerisation domain
MDKTDSDKNSRSTDASSSGRMSQLIAGFASSMAISVAARLRIADLLGEAPKTVEELAAATKSHAPSLRRLLRSLASFGVFEEDASGKYRNTPMSETMRCDHPQSVRSGAFMCGSGFFWKSWGELYETVLDGKTAFNRIFGAPIFDYLKTHPEEAAIFNATMTESAPRALSAIPAAYDFSRFERIVDVGGGHGALISGILSANPRLRGVLLDLPQVVADASASLRTAGVDDRCEVVGGDFFTGVTEGADCYVLKGVIHDWSDEHAVKILRSCRRAIRRDGTLLLLERLLKPANQPDPARHMDMNMMVLMAGQERTESEFRALLAEAGFSLTRVIPTRVPWQIIESHPA